MGKAKARSESKHGKDKRVHKNDYATCSKARQVAAELNVDGSRTNIPVIRSESGGGRKDTGFWRGFGDAFGNRSYDTSRVYGEVYDSSRDYRERESGRIL
ncbi:MAG: hypothetical protein WC796_05030 [Candidatus Pacearchaeota archaeon]|jgi:hypothetical protein